MLFKGLVGGRHFRIATVLKSIGVNEGGRIRYRFSVEDIHWSLHRRRWGSGLSRCRQIRVGDVAINMGLGCCDRITTYKLDAVIASCLKPQLTCRRAKRRIPAGIPKVSLLHYVAVTSENSLPLLQAPFHILLTSKLHILYLFVFFKMPFFELPSVLVSAGARLLC